MEPTKTIYRVAVSGLTCRSAVEFVNLKIAGLAGVEAASISADHVLTVFADPGSVSPDDLVRVLIDAGVVPDGDITSAAVAPRDIEPEADLVSVDTVFEMSAPVSDEPEAVLVPEARSAGHDYPHAVQSRTSHTATEFDPVSAPVGVAVDDSLQAAVDEPVSPISTRASIVQQVKVAVSDDYYPNRIEVFPGVPVEIEFGEGHGCLATVVFEQFGIERDLTRGGAVVRLPGLAPGEYQFSCGMHMVFGTVVAEA